MRKSFFIRLFFAYGQVAFGMSGNDSVVVSQPDRLLLIPWVKNQDPLSPKKSPHSILGKKNQGKAKKEVEWRSEAEEMFFESALDIEEQESDEGKPERVCRDENGKSHDCIYDCICEDLNGLIVAAVEDAELKRNMVALTALSKVFSEMLEGEVSESRNCSLQKALESIAKEKEFLLKHFGEDFDCTETKTSPLVSVKRESLMYGDVFEKVLTEAINSHDKNLLEDLQRSVFDEDSQQYKRIESALIDLRKKEATFERIFAAAVNRKDMCTLEALKPCWNVESQSYKRISSALINLQIEASEFETMLSGATNRKDRSALERLKRCYPHGSRECTRLINALHDLDKA
jgi:hypothetical protein